jgi:anti-anti-sigma regulatory factor
VGVDRLRPGDHACLHFDDDDARWEVLAVFARTGFALGEKVMFFVDRGTSEDEVVERISSHDGSARAARSSGQLAVYSTPSWYTPDARFDASRTISQTLEKIETACREGYPGVRATGDMGWALRPGMQLSELVEYEEAAHRELFADGRFTGICQYDQQRFSSQLTGTMSAIHSLTVIERIGDLHVSFTDSGLRLAGDSDLWSRGKLTAALKRVREQSGGRMLLDLSGLSFMDGHSAGAIIHMAARMSAGELLEVRCGQHHASILRLLGAETVDGLVLAEEGW